MGDMHISTTLREDTYLLYYISIIYPLYPLQLLLDIVFNIAILFWGIYPIDIFYTYRMVCVQDNLF